MGSILGLPRLLGPLVRIGVAWILSLLPAGTLLWRMVWRMVRSLSVLRRRLCLQPHGIPHRQPFAGDERAVVHQRHQVRTDVDKPRSFIHCHEPHGGRQLAGKIEADRLGYILQYTLAHNQPLDGISDI